MQHLPVGAQQAQDGSVGFWTVSSGNQRISPAAVALSGWGRFISSSMGSTDPLSAQPIYHATDWARIWEGLGFGQTTKVLKASASFFDPLCKTGENPSCSHKN